MEEVAEGVVLACYAEVEEFDGLGGFAAVDTGALYSVEWLVIVCNMGGRYVAYQLTGHNIQSQCFKTRFVEHVE